MSAMPSDAYADFKARTADLTTLVDRLFGPHDDDDDATAYLRASLHAGLLRDVRKVATQPLSDGSGYREALESSPFGQTETVLAAARLNADLDEYGRIVGDWKALVGDVSPGDFCE